MEIFIDVDLEVLKRRDSKKIYSNFASGQLNNIVGLDIEFPVPRNSDYVVKNNGSLSSLLQMTQVIHSELVSK